MPIGPNGERRSGNVVANAMHCCRVLVGGAEGTYSGKQRSGGKARAAKLSPERRHEIARKAAEAW